MQPLSCISRFRDNVQGSSIVHPPEIFTFLVSFFDVYVTNDATFMKLQHKIWNFCGSCIQWYNY